MIQNTLVIGGTGKTGRKVATRLQQLGHSVRIGSRQAQPAFDWQKPSTWAAALEGIQKVYITFQPDLAVPGAHAAIQGLVKEAQNQGVQKMVLLSGKGEAEAERCEQVLAQSGLDYTIVRASWFMQNFSESFFLPAIQAGHMALPQATAQVPYVDTGDIAEVVVASLLDPQHNSQTYELTGPRTLTFPQIAREISELTNREIQFTPIAHEDYLSQLKQAGVPADYVWLIDYLFTEVLDAEGNNQVTQDIEKVLGRPARDFSDYAKEVAATGIWDPVSVQA